MNSSIKDKIKKPHKRSSVGLISNLTSAYHQVAYKAVNTITTPTVAMLKPLSVSKLTSSKLTLLSVLGAFDINDTRTQIPKQSKNTKPTLSINGNSGQSILNKIEKTAEPRAAAKAPIELALDQNIPIKKITTMPGVKKPVNS